MDRGLRKTGIAPVGDVLPGTHFCRFYQTQQDLVDVLIQEVPPAVEDMVGGKIVGVQETRWE